MQYFEKNVRILFFMILQKQKKRQQKNILAKTLSVTRLFDKMYSR